mmetsp:Transcript_18409/g.24299  ORF Transcript_18409/g.24299 Transcript_18409/m.24299 type:complete len:81 (-) Transcript_18409:80-322(-)
MLFHVLKERLVQICIIFRRFIMRYHRKKLFKLFSCTSYHNFPSTSTLFLFSGKLPHNFKKKGGARVCKTFFGKFGGAYVD